MSAREEPRRDAYTARTTTRGVWALWLVAVSLVAVVAASAYFAGRASRAQERIAVLEEAGALGSQLTLRKAQQMARFEALLLTGDRSFREQYEASVAAEDSVMDRLQVLSRDLDFAVRERLNALQVGTVAWQYENQRSFRGDATGDALAASRGGYADLQRGTRELERAIQSEVAEDRKSVV